MFCEKRDVSREFRVTTIEGVSVKVSSVNIGIASGQSSDTVSLRYHGWSLRKPQYVLDAVDGIATFADTSSAQGLGNLRLDITIPASFSGILTIMTSSGNIDINSLSAGRFSLETVSGNLVAGEIRAESVSFVSRSGNRIVRRLQTDRLEASSSSGSVRVDDCLARDVSVKTTSGAIRVSFGDFSQTRISAASVTGGVTVFVPESAAFSFEIHSQTGTVTSDIPAFAASIADRRQASGATGSGESVLSAETRTGSIAILNRR